MLEPPPTLANKRAPAPATIDERRQDETLRSTVGAPGAKRRPAGSWRGRPGPTVRASGR